MTDGGGGAGRGGEGGAVCGVCRRQFGRYCCPRCRAPYCGAACFARHSERCTEAFFREQVEGELRARAVGVAAGGGGEPREMAQILERLRRMGEGELSDGEESVEGQNEGGVAGLTAEAAERLGLARLGRDALKAALEGLELSEADLSADALNCFRRDLQAGAVGRLLGGWEPWWRHKDASELRLSKVGTLLVRALDGPGPGGMASSIVPPPPSEPLPQLLDLLPDRQPAPTLPWHLVDCLFSYCSTLVLYNGDWQADPRSAAEHAIGTSGVLLPSHNASSAGPETLRQALSGCMDRCCSLLGRDRDGSSGTAALAAAEDAGTVLQCGRPAVLCALNDASALLTSQGSRSRRAAKKLGFLLVWANELQDKFLKDLGSCVLDEVDALREMPRRQGEVLTKD